MYLFVALGGALGSMFRYFLSSNIKDGGNFPLPTFIINLFGAFLIALISFYVEKWKYIFYNFLSPCKYNFLNYFNLSCKIYYFWKILI